MKKIAPIAVPLLVAFYAVPWVLYLRNRPAAAHVRTVRTESHTVLEPPPAPPPSPAKAEPPPVPAAPSAPGVDFEGPARKLVAEEARKFAEAEAAIGRLADGLALAESYRIARRWADLADLVERLFRQRPDLQFVLIDPRGLRYRLNKVIVPLGQMLRESKLALLDATPAASAAEQEIRDGLRIRLTNEWRELRRQQEELDLRREPANAARIEDGHSGPFSPVDPAEIARDVVDTKLQSMRLTFEFSGRPLDEAVSFLREMSGLNIVMRGVDPKATLVTISLKDVTMDGVLEHLTAAAGLTWTVDRFGILTLAPRK